MKKKLKGSNKVIVITPRRVGWKDDETSIFYIKCESKAQQSALCHAMMYTMLISIMFIFIVVTAVKRSLQIDDSTFYLIMTLEITYF